MLVERNVQVTNVEIVGEAYDIAAYYLKLRDHPELPADPLGRDDEWADLGRQHGGPRQRVSL